MSSEVILLDCWPRPFGMRVRIALAEKGIQYEYREENLRDKSSLLLEMNPVGRKIPVLIHNGKPISESLNIVEYIDEVWRETSPLMPDDPRKRALVRFWADSIDKKIDLTGRRIWTKKDGEQEKAKKELLEALKLLEEELGDKLYFGGETLGYLDVALVPFYPSFYSFEMCGRFNIEAECPKIVAWAKRCMEKDSVSRSLPDQHKIYEFLLEMKKIRRA